MVGIFSVGPSWPLFIRWPFMLLLKMLILCRICGLLNLSVSKLCCLDQWALDWSRGTEICPTFPVDMVICYHCMGMIAGREYFGVYGLNLLEYEACRPWDLLLSCFHFETRIFIGSMICKNCPSNTTL